MDKVRCVKITRAAFAALDEKDGNAIYFVSESGDFSPESLDTRGEVYLGDKLVGTGDDVSLDGDTLVAGEAGSPSGGAVTRNFAIIDYTAGGTMLAKREMNATVKRLMGSGCVVWHQLVLNGDFSQWGSNLLPTGWTNGSGFTSNNVDVTRINSGETSGMRVEFKEALSGTRYIYCLGPYNASKNIIISGHVYYLSAWVRSNIQVMVGGRQNNNNRITISPNTTGEYVRYKKTIIGTNYASISLQVSNPFVGSYFEIRDLQMFDLTVMFGAGNEPTAEEFEAMFPFAFNEWQQQSARTLMGFNTGKTYDISLLSFGYNLALWHGTYRGASLKSGSYVIEGAYTLLSFTPLTKPYTPVTPTVDSNGVFEVTEDGFLYIEGGDSTTTCVHRLGDGSMSGWSEPFVNGVALDYYELGTLFQYGLLAIGDVMDEVVTDADGYARTAIQRIGVRDYESGDEEDTSVVTDLTHTAYVLQSAVTHQLTNPIKMTYKAYGWGIEKVETYAPTLPILYEVEYTGEAVTKVNVDGDLRNIEDWRIGGVDGAVTSGGANPVTGAAVAAYVDNALGDIETLLSDI